MTSNRNPPAFRFRPGRRQDILIVCDHASNAVPDELGTLGLDGNALLQHVAWDPGAAGVAEAMAEQLDCPALFGVWSRLVVDLNREAAARDLIVTGNDGIDVPGNRLIAKDERDRRIERYHRPYHAELSRHLDAVMSNGIRPALISIHSFVPSFFGNQRPWPIGLLWKHRHDWLDRLFDELRRQGLDVGDNEPYDGREMMGGTLEQHAIPRGLRHVLVELRQDLLATDQMQVEWSRRLLDALQAAGFFASQSVD